MHRWQHYIDRVEEITELIRSTYPRLSGERLSRLTQGHTAQELRESLMKDDEGAEDVFVLLITAHAVKGELFVARDIALEAHAAYPKHQELIEVLVELHTEVQDHHAALSLLDEVEKRMGSSTRTQLNRAWCYLAMKMPRECFEIMEAVWREDEVEMKDREMRVLCLRLLDRPQEALDYIEGLQVKGIDSPSLGREIIYCLLGLGERDRAEEMIADLAHNRGPQAVLYEALAFAYEEAGELNKAKASYQKGFEQAPDNDGICLFLSLLPDDLFDNTEALPVQYIMRASYRGGLAKAIIPAAFITALVRHRLPMQLIDLLVGQNEGVQLITVPEQSELLRLGRPYERLFTYWSSQEEPELIEVEAVLRYHLGDVGGCFRLLDERILVDMADPSFLIRYYYLLSGALLLEDMSELARVNARVVLDKAQDRTLSDSDAYYGALILRCAGMDDSAEFLVHRSLSLSPTYMPLRMLQCRFALEADNMDEAPLRSLVNELAREPNYYRDPTVLTLDLAGVHAIDLGMVPNAQSDEAGSLLTRIMPVLHFLEQFEVLSSVETYIRPYRTEVPGVDPFSSSERPIFTLCRVIEPDPITGLLEDEVGAANTGVRSLAGILELGKIEGELGKWVDGYVSMGLDKCISELGLEIYERTLLAMSDTASVPPAIVVDKVSRAFLVAGALLKDHPDRLDDVLALQHYCQYALRSWARAIPAEVISEAESQATDQLLKAIGQMDVAADALAYAVFTFNPGLWVCTKAISKTTRWVYTRYIDEGFVSFDRYKEWIISRKQDKH